MLFILFNVVSDIKGWTFDEMLFLYGFSTTSCAIWHCFFINTITIPYYVKTGELDRFLMRPYNPLFLILIEGFDEDGWGELLFGIIVSTITVIRLKISILLVLLLPLLWIAGALVYAGISILLSTISFFTIENMDLTDITMQLNDFCKYPISVYGIFLRILFSTVIPIGFSAYYPSLPFIRSSVQEYILYIPLTVIASIAFFFLCSKFWMWTLKRYTSSGY